MEEDFSYELEKKIRNLDKDASDALTFADLVTGGRFTDSLIPKSKSNHKSICEDCIYNFDKTGFCQTCDKTWHKSIELKIKSCDGFKSCKA